MDFKFQATVSWRMTLAGCALALGGCASTATQDSIEQRTANAVGRPVGSFSISDRSEETGGRVNYTVRTRDGATYRCYMVAPTTFVKVMSFGQVPDSDAICSAMGRGAGTAAPAATCNALLKAAGKC